jgi:hypothetical protein
MKQHAFGGGFFGDDDHRFGGGHDAGGPATGADPFAAFVNALIAHPIPWLPVAVGETATAGATGTLLWSDDAHGDFHLEATTGFLNTATGSGGFTLDVRADGSYALHFSGSDTTLSFNACGGATTTTPVLPSGNTTVYSTTNGPVLANASAGGITYDGQGSASDPVTGYDTVFGGVGDVLIGNASPHEAVATGNVGNCAIYTTATNSSVPAGSVLVDMQANEGFGSNAEGNVYVNINQIRGSLQSNVLIGSPTGTDLKSGGDDSVLISLGGNGFELRPDGTGDVLVSTVGADRVLLDPTHGWKLGDTTTLLGFNPDHGVFIDLTLLEKSLGVSIASDLTGFLQITDTAAGAHLLFSPSGNVAAGGIDLLDMPLVHGLDPTTLVADKNIVI